MTDISSAEIESGFRFTVNTKTLKKSKSVCTPTFKFSNSKWQVRFSRKTNDCDEKCLAIHLESVSLKKTSFFGENKKQWSCEAQATFKLLRTDGHIDKPIVKHLSRKTFEKNSLSHGVDDFVQWDAFLKDYADSDLVTFEINISTSPLKPTRNTMQEMIPISSKQIVVIKNANKLGNVTSNKTVLQGICWTVQIKKENGHVAIFLNCNDNDMDDDWYYKVDVKFSLQSSNLKSYSKHFVHAFVKGERGRGYRNFIKWTDFVDQTKGYIDNSRANLKVEIKVEDPEPMWKLDVPIPPTPLKTSPSFECIATPS